MKKLFWKSIATLAKLIGKSIKIHPVRRVSRGKFCDYCRCDGCQLGLDWEISGPRLECADGTHICSICYHHEPCTEVVAPFGKKRNTYEMCSDAATCTHKPRLK